MFLPTHAIDCDMDEDCSCGASASEKKTMARSFTKEEAPTEMAKIIRAVADRVETARGDVYGTISVKTVMVKKKPVIKVTVNLAIHGVKAI